MDRKETTTESSNAFLPQMKILGVITGSEAGDSGLKDDVSLKSNVWRSAIESCVQTLFDTVCRNDHILGSL